LAEEREEVFRLTIQFFQRAAALLEEKHAKYDGKITADSPPRKFSKVTHKFKNA